MKNNVIKGDFGRKKDSDSHEFFIEKGPVIITLSPEDKSGVDLMDFLQSGVQSHGIKCKISTVSGVLSKLRIFTQMTIDQLKSDNPSSVDEALSTLAGIQSLLSILPRTKDDHLTPEEMFAKDKAMTERYEVLMTAIFGDTH